MIDKIRHSKIVIVVFIIFFICLYLCLLLLPNYIPIRATDRNVPKEPVVQNEPIIKEKEPEVDITPEENKAQLEILDFITNISLVDNYTLYCEADGHSYYLLNKGNGCFKIQYDNDLYYRVEETKIKYSTDDQTWLPLKQHDEQLYTIYSTLINNFNLANKYASAASQNTTKNQPVKVYDETFVGDITLNNQILQINMSSEYRDIYIVITYVGETYY